MDPPEGRGPVLAAADIERPLEGNEDAVLLAIGPAVGVCKQIEGMGEESKQMAIQFDIARAFHRPVLMLCSRQVHDSDTKQFNLVYNHWPCSRYSWYLKQYNKRKGMDGGI